MKIIYSGFSPATEVVITSRACGKTEAQRQFIDDRSMPDHYIRFTAFGTSVVEHVRFSNSDWALANCPQCHAAHDRFVAFTREILDDLMRDGEAFIGCDVQRDSIVFTTFSAGAEVREPTIKECDDKLAELRCQIGTTHKLISQEKARHEKEMRLLNGELESLAFARKCWRDKVQTLRRRLARTIERVHLHFTWPPQFTFGD
jgi:hypothetical protein